MPNSDVLKGLFQGLEESSEDIALIREIIIKELYQSHDEIKIHIDTLMDISVKKGYQIGIGIAHNLLGYYLENKNKNLEAREQQLISFKLFKALKNKSGQANACNGAITAAIGMGCYQDAIEWGEKGLQISYEEGNYETVSIISTNLAEAYFKYGDFLGAYNILSTLEKLPVKIDKYSTVIIHLNKAHASVELGYFKESKALLDKCYSLIDETSIWLLTEIEFVYAKLYFKENELQLALEMIKKSHENMKKSGHTILNVDIFVLWGEILSALEKYKEAEIKFIDSENLAKQNRLEAKLSLIYLGRYKSLKAQKKFKEALEYAKLYEEVQSLKRKNLCQESLMKIKAKQIEITAEIYNEINKSMEEVLTLGLAIVNNLSIEAMVKSLSNKIKSLTNIEEMQIQLYTDKGQIEYIINEHGNNTKDPDLKYIFTEPIESQNIIIGNLKLRSNQQEVFGVGGLYKGKLIAAYLAVALENINLMKKVVGAAELDYMTGILNRKSIMERLVEISTKKEQEKSSTIILVDIDNFKTINDNFGHSAGDMVIKKVADKISEATRAKDFCGRIGGEEFLIILPGLNLVKGKAIAERIRKSIELAWIESEAKELIKFTASFGVAQLDFQGGDISKIIERADNELYEAKRNGKNIVFG